MVLYPCIGLLCTYQPYARIMPLGFRINCSNQSIGVNTEYVSSYLFLLGLRTPIVIGGCPQTMEKDCRVRCDMHLSNYSVASDRSL